MPAMGVVTLAEAEEVLAREKALHADMHWSTAKGRMKFQWYQSRIILLYSDDVAIPEGLYVQCQWYRRMKSIPERWNFSLFFDDERIYGIDVQPSSPHRNNVGKGRPLYKQMIAGTHEHMWSQEGYGYAEPLNVPTDQPEIIWKMFLKRANIAPGEFFHPDDNEPELML
jgi:hypothetical protein